MNYLQGEIQAPAIVPVVEFVTPRLKPAPSNQISVTRSPWYNYQKRKEIIEEHRAPFIGIMRVMQQDGYARNAVAKYVNSIFLRGYKLVTLKPDIQRYIDIRMQMIVDAMPDHDHLDAFFHDVARDLVAYANVYIIKIRRRPGYLPAKMKLAGVPRIKPKGKPEDKPILEKQDPIAAYELIHPATMHIVRDNNGNVIRYEQWPFGETSRPVDAKNRRQWDPDQVIHMLCDREDGFAYGHPFLAPVLDDIRMLRSIEDHTSRLAFRFAFPFTQVKVGETTPGFQATEEQLEFYKKLVQNAPPDATMVTAEMVEFNVIGAEGEAINLEPYLGHFQQRAFTSLGVSSVSMGIGDTTNRSTADAMSVEMHDSIKHYQNILARSITKEIFRELLQEGGWELYENFEKNWVHLRFNEIEVENQIRTETHIKDLLQSNMITFEEARERMGDQPFTLKEWADTFLIKFLLPQDIVKLTGTTDIDEHGEIMLQKHKADMSDNKREQELHPKALAAADADINKTKADSDNVKADTALKKKELAQPAETPGGAVGGAHVTTTVATKQIPGGGRSKSVTIKKPVTAPKGHFAPQPGAPGPAAQPVTGVKKTANQQRPTNQHGTRTAPKRKTEGLSISEAIFSRDVNMSTRLVSFHKELIEMYEELRQAAIEQAKLHIDNRDTSYTDVEMSDWLYKLVEGRLTRHCERYLQNSFYSGASRLFQEVGLTAPMPGHLSEREALRDFNERTIRRLIKDLTRPSITAINSGKPEEKVIQKINDTFDNCKYRLELISNTELPQAFWFGYASAAKNSVIPIELQVITQEESCEECTSQPKKYINPDSARTRLKTVPTFHPLCDCSLEPVYDRIQDPEEGE